LAQTLAGVSVAFEAASAEQCLERLGAHPVDVLVADIRMPRMDGIELIRELRARGDTTPVLLLTTFDEPGLLQRAVRAGAQGFLLKDTSPEDFQAALEQVAAGKSVLNPLATPAIRSALGAPAQPALHDAPSLTEREVSILRLAAAGHSNKEIARSLGLAEGTVKNYMSDMLLKLEARDRTQAVLKAITLRLL
ncbi:MAG: response regulator transcription factor, partial [Gammaproteobacteria bacterium]|nr:response regulator transcription factor [Gammaproteobacteria bacterium]